MRLTRPRGAMPPTPAFTTPTPKASPESFRFPGSDDASAAAASVQPRGGLGLPSRPPGLIPSPGDRGADTLDELTLRALDGDR